MWQPFKEKLKNSTVVGCFVKTAHPAVVEILGQSEFDFLILDAEHAPFDRTSIDLCILASRAVGIPTLVRVPSLDWILNVLDAGAAGVVVPHVTTVHKAQNVVRSCYYDHSGGRGFAGTTRAANYGLRSATSHFETSHEEVSVICQIEDMQGVENAEAIAGVPGVDALLVGRADLAVSAQTDFGSSKVSELTRNVLQTQGTCTGLYCTPGEDTNGWQEAGARLFAIGSDHTLLRSGANEICKRLL